LEIPKALAEAAAFVASKTKEVDAILIHTQSGKNCSWLLEHLKDRRIKIIVASRDQKCLSVLPPSQQQRVKLISVHHWHRGQLSRIPQVIARCLEQGYLRVGDKVLCLMGNGAPDFTDAIKYWRVTGEERVFDWGETLVSTVSLALELASCEVEGKPVGAAFMIGDWKRVLRYSHPLIPDPLSSYKANIKRRDSWEMIKKIAANFDGAFVIADDGVIKASCRRLDANRRVRIPEGLGTRHHAVAAMTAATSAKGITVSQEDRMIRIFKNGRIVAKINPKGTMLEHLDY
jgi:DNA integrity scanning protein DisA with diadenylate cyclase activity